MSASAQRHRRAVPDERLLEPAMDDWTGKDLLVHMAWWHDHSVRVIEGLERPPSRTTPTIPRTAPTRSTSGRTESTWTIHRNLRGGCSTSHSLSRLLAALEPVTDDELFIDDRWPWLDGEALVETVLWDSSRHYEEHRDQLEPLRAEGPHASGSARAPTAGSVSTPSVPLPRRIAPRPHAPRLRAGRPDSRVWGLPRAPRLRRAPDRLRGGPDAPGGAGRELREGRKVPHGSGRTASPLVGCPEGDALLEVVAFEVKHVAPAARISVSLGPVPAACRNRIRLKPQRRFRLAKEPSAAEPQQRARASDHAPSDHDAARAGGVRSPEGLVVVPAAVLLGVLRVQRPRRHPLSQSTKRGRLHRQRRRRAPRSNPRDTSTGQGLCSSCWQPLASSSANANRCDDLRSNHPQSDAVQSKSVPQTDARSGSVTRFRDTGARREPAPHGEPGRLIPQLWWCLSRGSAGSLRPCLRWRTVGTVRCTGRALRRYQTKPARALRRNPGGAMELKHKAPEVTFLGAHDQPDFGTLYVTFYPGEKVIELRISTGVPVPMA